MTVRKREWVPDSWSLVRERALTTGLCAEGWYSEHSVRKDGVPNTRVSEEERRCQEGV